MPRGHLENRPDSLERGCSQGDPAGAFALRFKACPGLIGEFSCDGDELFTGHWPSGDRRPGAPLPSQEHDQRPSLIGEISSDRDDSLPRSTSFVEGYFDEGQRAQDADSHDASEAFTCDVCPPAEYAHLHFEKQDAAGQVQQCVVCRKRDRLSVGSKDDLNHLVTRNNQEPYWVNNAVAGEQIDGSCVEPSTGT